MKTFLLTAALIALLVANSAARAAAKPPPVASDGMVKVAVVLSDGATVIDFAGPWEVFADTMLKGAGGRMIMPFKLYTVAASRSPIRTEGSNGPGFMITPDYDFADAPTPDIVVVGAQSGGAGLSAWLEKVHAEHRTIMSVCTGAFLLARTGLLNGKRATTHHWFFGQWSHAFPNVRLVKGVRYVQSSPTLLTAGGEASGIDLALHMVAKRFGEGTAQATANFMEYQGNGWRTNDGISPLDAPVSYKTWTGTLAPGLDIALRLRILGASPVSAITDIPAWHVRGAATSIDQRGQTVTVTVHAGRHPITFIGRVTKGSVISGTLVRAGTAYQLILRRAKASTAHPT
ncbi:MAG: DJ-1/PfpI family protein [Steroidobacteraceae bacterium]